MVTAYLDEQYTDSETDKVTIDSPVAGERLKPVKTLI